jgi:hypothetical protein
VAGINRREIERSNLSGMVPLDAPGLSLLVVCRVISRQLRRRIATICLNIQLRRAPKAGTTTRMNTSRPPTWQCR